MKKLKLTVGIIAAVALIAVLVLTLPWPQRVYKTIEGLRWSDTDESLCEPVELKIAGRYYHYLLKDDRFKGEINISCIDDTYGYTFDFKLMPLPNLSNNKGKWASPACYKSAEKSLGPIGYIYLRGSFDKVFIEVDDDFGGGLISAPASTRAEAAAGRLFGE